MSRRASLISLGAGLALTLAGVLPSLVLAQNVQFLEISPGDRTVSLTWNRAPGDTLTPGERDTTVTRAFGGYQIWRSDNADPESFTLLRTYALFDTTWSFTLDGTRTFNDPDSIRARSAIPEDPRSDDEVVIPGPFNGFAYFYAVTWFDAVIDSSGGSGTPVNIEVQGLAEGIRQEPVFPSKRARVASPILDAVAVVPNPYNPGASFGQQAFPGPPRVQFINLPSQCEVEIYTVSGDLVRRLNHASSDDSEDWDLKNHDGRDVASGIYVYNVTAGAESTVGRFVVIR